MLGKRVLVIDDEENLRHYLQMVLKEAGYQVETASEGVEALQKMQHQAWDIVLCDIRMPRMDGMAFLKEVKAGAGGDDHHDVRLWHRGHGSRGDEDRGL